MAGQTSFPSKTSIHPAQTIKAGNHARFTPSDWSASNLVHYNNADASRQESERIRNEAVRLMRDTEDKTVMSQRDADRRIGERLGDEVSSHRKLHYFGNVFRHTGGLNYKRSLS
jgi:hypothetical protein